MQDTTCVAARTRIGLLLKEKTKWDVLSKFKNMAYNKV
jgi:hypothetical protein